MYMLSLSQAADPSFMQIATSNKEFPFPCHRHHHHHPNKYWVKWPVKIKIKSVAYSSQGSHTV